MMPQPTNKIQRACGAGRLADGPMLVRACSFEMISTHQPRPIGFLALGIFLFFGSLMATYAAITLAIPGTILDRAWVLNPTAHAQLAPLGRVAALPFAVLAATLFAAGVGWFRRRYWGWILGVSLIAMNMTGDLVNIFRGELLKGMVGAGVAGLLLVYLTRPRVRNYLRGQQLSSGPSTV